MATFTEVWNAQNVMVQAASVTAAATVVTALIAGYYGTLHKLIEKEHWKPVIGLLVGLPALLGLIYYLIVAPFAHGKRDPRSIHVLTPSLPPSPSPTASPTPQFTESPSPRLKLTPSSKPTPLPVPQPLPVYSTPHLVPERSSRQPQRRTSAV